MLFYLEVLAAFMTFAMSLELYSSAVGIYQDVSDYYVNSAQTVSFHLVNIILFLFIITLLILIHFFYGFQKRIVRENKTTLEHLEQEAEPYQSVYDVDQEDNYLQVMGTSYWLTWLPIITDSSFHPCRGLHYEKQWGSEDSEDDGDRKDGLEATTQVGEDTGKNENNNLNTELNRHLRQESNLTSTAILETHAKLINVTASQDDNHCSRNGIRLQPLSRKTDQKENSLTNGPQQITDSNGSAKWEYEVNAKYTAELNEGTLDPVINLKQHNDGLIRHTRPKLESSNNDNS